MGLFSRTILGVDIGHGSVKVVGLTVNGNKPVFLGCQKVNVDPKHLQKEGFDDPVLLAQAIHEAMRTAAPKPLPTSAVYTAIPESMVFRKSLEMPIIESPRELADAIRLEISQFLPGNLEETELDFQRVSLSPDGTSQQIMVVAAPKAIVDTYMAVFKAAKLPLKAIDVKSAAIGRAIVGMKERASLLLVDIGSVVSSISLYQDGVVRVTGTVNMGGDLVRDPGKAELSEDHEVQAKRLATALADEIDHVLKFYINRTTDHREVKEIHLVGGGSMIVGVKEAIAEEVELPVVVGKYILTVPAFCDRGYSVALGSALYPLTERV